MPGEKRKIPEKKQISSRGTKYYDFFPVLRTRELGNERKKTAHFADARPQLRANRLSRQEEHRWVHTHVTCNAAAAGRRKAPYNRQSRSVNNFFFFPVPLVHDKLFMSRALQQYVTTIRNIFDGLNTAGACERSDAESGRLVVKIKAGRQNAVYPTYVFFMYILNGPRTPRVIGECSHIATGVSPVTANVRGAA